MFCFYNFSQSFSPILTSLIEGVVSPWGGAGGALLRGIWGGKGVGLYLVCECREYFKSCCRMRICVSFRTAQRLCRHIRWYFFSSTKLEWLTFVTCVTLLALGLSKNTYIITIFVFTDGSFVCSKRKETSLLRWIHIFDYKSERSYNLWTIFSFGYWTLVSHSWPN